MAFVKHGIGTSLGPIEIKQDSKSELNKKQEMTQSPSIPVQNINK